MPRKKQGFKHTFDIIQALIFPVMLVVTAQIFISQEWVKAEDIAVVWAVILINVIASLASIIVASKLSG